MNGRLVFEFRYNTAKFEIHTTLESVFRDTVADFFTGDAARRQAKQTNKAKK